MPQKICPKCNKTAITLFKFLNTFNQSRIRCSSCKAKLIGNKLLRVLFYTAIVFGLSLGWFIADLEHLNNWGPITSLKIAIVAILIIGIPGEIIAWKYGDYQIDPKAVNNP